MRCCRSKPLARLYELWLSNNEIGDDGMVALADALAVGALAGLGDLRLQFNAIGEVGLRALAAAVSSHGALANTWYLGLSDNRFGDDALRALEAAIAAGGLARLEFLTITSASVSDAAHASAQATLNGRRRR